MSSGSHRRSVGLKDIAFRAGVSAMTVSAAINGMPGVSREKASQILRIAHELNYHPNRLAQSIRTGNSQTIGVLINFAALPNFVPLNMIFAGIMIEASRRHQTVQIFQDSNLELSFQEILENRIDKLISLSPRPAPREKTAAFAEENHLKLVFGYEHGIRSFPAVNVDNVEMACNLVRHLASHGHRRIGLLGVPHIYQYIIDRHEGYLQGLKESGLEICSDWIFCNDDVSGSLDSVLTLAPERRPTAFVTLCDTIAAEAYAYFQQHGFRIPEDFSLISIGNSEISRFLNPPLTTAEEQLKEYGILLIRLLLDHDLDMEPDHYNVYHTHARIIERKSIAKIQEEK